MILGMTRPPLNFYFSITWKNAKEKEQLPQRATVQQIGIYGTSYSNGGCIS
jgi:hypothetical protein